MELTQEQLDTAYSKVKPILDYGFFKEIKSPHQTMGLLKKFFGKYPATYEGNKIAIKEFYKEIPDNGFEEGLTLLNNFLIEVLAIGRAMDKLALESDKPRGFKAVSFNKIEFTPHFTTCTFEDINIKFTEKVKDLEGINVSIILYAWNDGKWQDDSVQVKVRYEDSGYTYDSTVINILKVYKYLVETIDHIRK